MKTRYAMTALSLTLLATAILYNALAQGSTVKSAPTVQNLNIRDQERSRLLSMFTPEQRRTANEIFEWLKAHSVGWSPWLKSSARPNRSPQR